MILTFQAHKCSPEGICFTLSEYIPLIKVWTCGPILWSVGWGVSRRYCRSCFICAWTNGGANNRGAGDLRRHRAHYDVTVMKAFHLMILLVVLMLEVWRSQPATCIFNAIQNIWSDMPQISTWRLTRNRCINYLSIFSKEYSFWKLAALIN